MAQSRRAGVKPADTVRLIQSSEERERDLAFACQAVIPGIREVLANSQTPAALWKYCFTRVSKLWSYTLEKVFWSGGARPPPNPSGPPQSKK